MKKIFHAFLYILLFYSFQLTAGNKVSTAYREIEVLKRQFELYEAKQKVEINELKKNIAVLDKELEAIKNQKAFPTKEIYQKLDDQSKSLTDSKELEHILIKYGNNPDGLTSLHYAIKMGDLNAVNLLIAYGADINARDITGESGTMWNYTALTRAVFYNQTEVVKLLIDLGADVNLTVTLVNHSHCPYKFDALYYAAQQGNSSIINLLIENGANLESFYGDSYGTPLHVASQSGNYEAVVALVTAGANLNKVIKQDNYWTYGTPLDHAAYNLNYKENPKSLDVIKFLVEHGGKRTQMKDVGCPVINGYLKSIGR